MARQISVSNEVYMELSKKKGKRSFSEVILGALTEGKNKQEMAEGKAADARILARIKKGYRFGKILYRSRGELHDR